MKANPTNYTKTLFYSSNYFVKKLFKRFISLGCKYNKLQLGVRISSIEASRQKLLIIYNKICNKETKRDSFFKSKGIRSDFRHLVPLIFFSACPFKPEVMLYTYIYR